MATLIEFIVFGVINVITTALAVILSDRYIKKQVEKVVVHFENKIKEVINHEAPKVSPQS